MQLQHVRAGRSEVLDAAAHLRVVHVVVVLADSAVARDPRERVEQTRLKHARRGRVAARPPARAQHRHQLVRSGHRLGTPARVRPRDVPHQVCPERVSCAGIHPPASARERSRRVELSGQAREQRLYI